mmetsp:Transcript_25351/g.58766  ORF Transcript_25351/g.58766 Transcript_25351/m.58766 type:complete len:944 (-) Transcript_25351:162-2993(-)
MRALIRNEPLDSHNLPTTAAGVSVHGAGSREANGIYVRTGYKVANTEVFQKRGTGLALLQRGEGLHWSLVNLNGRTVEYGSDKDPDSAAVSAFSAAKLRWNPNSLTLYQVAASLHSRANMLPPQVGWTVVDGLSPAPSMTFCDPDSLRPEKLLAAAIPGKLLKRIAESAPTAAKVQTSIHQAWRSDAQQKLPRMLRWGTLETSKLRRQEATQEVQKMEQSLSLPDLRPAGHCLQPAPAEGEPVMVIYNVVISRPNFLFDWGLLFDVEELEATGRKFVKAVEPNSPFDRWNTWQQVRGRPEMCVRPGDQMLKQSGAWAYYECPLESSEGFEDLPRISEAARVEGTGDTLLVLEMGRFERRPCPPEPPRLEPWEAGFGLRMELDAVLAGPYEQDVVAWALVLREDLSEAAFVSTTSGKSESCWRAFDGESGKVQAVIRDAEIGAVMHGGAPITLHLSEGLKTGRTYSACVAVLTEAGWSAFSYPSRPVHVKQRPGLIDGILALVLPPEDEQYMTMTSLSKMRKRLARATVSYFLPSEVQAGFTAPIATHSTISEPCELFSTRKLLKLSLVLPHGRPKGLEVTEEGGSTLYVVDEGKSPGTDPRVLRFTGQSVPWKLCSGDFIVCINGLTGAERMVEELRHNPPVLALEVLRPVGGKKEGEAAQVFELNIDLDGDCQTMVSEIRKHGLLSSEAKLLSLSVGTRDDLIEEVLDQVKTFRRDVAPKRPSDGAPIPEAEEMDNAILAEAQKRVLVLHRFRMMEQTAQEEGQGDGGQLSEACRLLQWAMADVGFSSEKLGKGIQDFKQLGGVAVRASAPAQVLLKRAMFQMDLWHWRDRLRQERKELKEATSSMVQMELLDQEHSKRFPGIVMKKQDVERIVQARNVLDLKVRQGQGFRQQLHYEMAEAEAVLRRSLRSAAGQRKLSLEEQNARFNPARTLTMGKNKGWW